LIINYKLWRTPATQGRHIPGFASLGASHASPLHAPHAKTYVPRPKHRKSASFIDVFQPQRALRFKQRTPEKPFVCFVPSSCSSWLFFNHKGHKDLHKGHQKNRNSQNITPYKETALSRKDRAVSLLYGS
jgi:hypothetical protein